MQLWVRRCTFQRILQLQWRSGDRKQGRITAFISNGDRYTYRLFLPKFGEKKKVRSYSIIDKIKLEEEPIPSSICLVKLSPKRVKEDLVALTAEHKLRSKEEETTSDLRDDDNLQHWHKNITNMTTSSTNSSEDMRYSEITKSKHTNWSPTISYLVQTFYTCTTIHQHKDQ